MTADTATETFSPPETVTIPGEIALEALALLNAYVEIAGGFRLDGEIDPFCEIEETVFESLLVALGQEPRGDLTTPLCDAMYERSRELEKLIVSHFDGPTLSAIVTTKIAHDLDEVKARLELSRA